MPAIQPARLKIQVSQLVEKYPSPKEFLAGFHDLLFYYADRTRSPGRGGIKYSLIRAYRVPKQVLREIERGLRPLVIDQGEQAFDLVDALWLEGWLETRILSLMILGWVPLEPVNRIVSRLEAWGQTCKDDSALLEVLAVLIASLWKADPRGPSLLESWLRSQDPAARKLGLRLIPFLIQLPSFQYLPTIYNLLMPYVQRSNLVPDPDLLVVVRALAAKSPPETAYFLERNLAAENPGVPTLIRQCLDAFPPPIRVDLQALLYQRREDLRAG